jgi:uncharacterized cupin superfamily protein
MTDRSKGEAPSAWLSAEQIEGLNEDIYPHPLNISAVRRMRALGDLTGLTRLGVHLVRLTPGHDSSEYHRHHNSDEFIYVLQGRGKARIGVDTVTVGPGDFLGFAAGGEAHSLFNPYEVDLVYLMGGNRPAEDICDYPEAGKRLRISGGERDYQALPAEAGKSRDDAE